MAASISSLATVSTSRRGVNVNIIKRKLRADEKAQISAYFNGQTPTDRSV